VTPLSTRLSLEVKGGQNALFGEGTISEQPHSIGACHGVSFRIRGVQLNSPKKNRAYSPPSAHLRQFLNTNELNIFLGRPAPLSTGSFMEGE